MSTIMTPKRRLGVVPVGLFVVMFVVACAVAVGLAQVTTVKRITSVQMGDASEGARVTMVSDSALNDYEAFRRGDRFYVRIPVANFASTEPRFRGDGFDNVQVQQAGDGVMVSFKLQPGATARVDQHSNRLDVIFSSPNRIARNNSLNRGTSGATSTGGRESSGGLNSDYTAVPLNSPYATRGSSVTSGENINSSAQSNSSAPTSVVSPTTSAPGSFVTPAPANSEQSAGASRVSGSSSWRDRTKQWVSANRRATAAGLLLVLGLLILVLLLRRRGNAVKARRNKGPLAQPTFSSGAELNESRPAGFKAGESSAGDEPLRVETTDPGTGSFERTSAEDIPVTQPAIGASVAASAATSSDYARVLTRPSIGTASPATGETSEEDREVFEL